MHVGDGQALNVTDSADSIDAQMSDWLSSAGTRDCFVHLHNIDGDAIRVLASSIDTLIVSTPEGRRNQLAFRRAAKLEAEGMRAELGFVPGDDD